MRCTSNHPHLLSAAQLSPSCLSCYRNTSSQNTCLST
nr:MAG TPA: hypothetical protein [Caudoviricetes sp.]DAV93021.1 MAG TPA: hypothetical protein [Bacteriophage sp.]